MFKKIDMNDYRSVAKDFDKRQARRSGLSLWLRIAHAAGAEMNRAGHAEFGGWLNLADYVKVDGEPLPLRRNVYKAVEKAIEFGYLSPESSVFCLVFNSADSQKAAHAGYGCKHHKIKTLKESQEILEGILVEFDETTGEIYEEPEASVSTSEELVVSEVQVIIPVPENPIVGQDEVPESIKEEVEMMNSEQVLEAIDEEVEFGVEEVAKTTTFTEWFDSLEDGMVKDVAAFGAVYKKRDGSAKIKATALEAVSEEHDWCPTIAIRYSYASMNVDVESGNDMVTVSVGDDEEW